MLRSHQKLELENKCLIEKVVLEAPFRFSVHFHDEACFIYFLKGAAKINSPVGQIDIGPKEAVLLQCGSYFADLLKYGTSGEYEILVPFLNTSSPLCCVATSIPSGPAARTIWILSCMFSNLPDKEVYRTFKNFAVSTLYTLRPFCPPAQIQWFASSAML